MERWSRDISLLENIYVACCNRFKLHSRSEHASVNMVMAALRCDWDLTISRLSANWKKGDRWTQRN